MSFELSDKKWQLTLSDGRRGPSRYRVDAEDTAAVAQCIDKADLQIFGYLSFNV
jgi:transposase